MSIAGATNGAATVYGYALANSTVAGAVGTITQRAVTVTAATDTKIYNGTTTSTGAPSVTVGSIVAGDTGSFSQSFNNKNAGTGKTLTATGSIADGNGGTNYSLTFVTDNSGVIIPATLNITANNQTKIYGQNIVFSGTEFSQTGLIPEEAVTSVSLTSAGAINTANVAGGPYAIIASNAAEATFDPSNYAITYRNGTMTVSPAPLSITANNANKAQGMLNPAFSSSFSGFVNSETSAVLNGSLGHTTPAITSSLVGTYPITPFGLTADNYSISFIDGVLLITPANTIPILASAVTRPDHVSKSCEANSITSPVIISGLDAYGLDNLDYRESISQPLVGGVVANALLNPNCLKP